MELLRTIEAVRAATTRGTALAIGMFDGVHRGHQMLIQHARDNARARGGSSLIFTFPRHPLSLLAPPYAPLLLCDADEKAELIARQGIDLCAMIDFTPEFAAMPADVFLREIVAGACRAAYLTCGEDFRFGQGGQGDVALLRRAAPELGLALDICPSLIDGALPIRSTRIRQALLEGRVAEAATLLDRPYALRARVARGDQRGRTIGYPTANLLPDPARLIPQNGVYAIHTETPAGRFGGMLNIGTRPTFELAQRTIEAHLFDFSGDLYDQTLVVEFVARVRDEKKFASVAALIEQLRADETTCRTVLASIQ